MFSSERKARAGQWSTSETVQYEKNIGLRCHQKFNGKVSILEILYFPIWNVFISRSMWLEMKRMIYFCKDRWWRTKGRRAWKIIHSECGQAVKAVVLAEKEKKHQISDKILCFSRLQNITFLLGQTFFVPPVALRPASNGLLITLIIPDSEETRPQHLWPELAIYWWLWGGDTSTVNAWRRYGSNMICIKLWKANNVHRQFDNLYSVSILIFNL